MFRSRLRRVWNFPVSSSSTLHRVRETFRCVGPVQTTIRAQLSETSAFTTDLISEDYDATAIAQAKMDRLKATRDTYKAKRQRIRDLGGAIKDGSAEEILSVEAQNLLIRHLREAEADYAISGEGEDRKHHEVADSTPRRPEPQTEVELEIEELSSTGDGLAYSPSKDFIYVVPFSIPGDTVLAKTFPQKSNPLYERVDHVKVLRPSPKRDGITPGCKYFGTCSGCQLQMMSYPDQLAHKKTIVERAFKHFSGLDPSLVPTVGDTVGSPLQYGYRTKLTPHWDGVSKHRSSKKGDKPPSIGFGAKNGRRVVDIEQCPIATPIVNAGMKIERQKVHEIFHQRKSGQTILIRESTRRQAVSPKLAEKKEAGTEPDAPAEDATKTTSAEATEAAEPKSHPPTSDASTTTPLTLPLPEPVSIDFRSPTPSTPEIVYTYPTYRDIKTYTSDHKAFATEHIGWPTSPSPFQPITFITLANSFFQNNNSILPTFLSYIRTHLLPNDPPASEPRIKYLLDAYCGSGLFSISLAPSFSSVLGIDIDQAGVSAARENSILNAVPNAGFIAADASHLFADVPFPPAQSLVVIDPPRKGASVDFLRQLCNFGAKRVVYVSCNVHTQARDVGMLVRGFGGRWRFEIERVRGFDFFPMTGHVEGVCILNRVENDHVNGVEGQKEN